MDFRLEENSPIYIQIMNRVRSAIASGELAPGDKVSSVREMAIQFEVNPNTMQRAMMELEREGYLISERNTGRFVTADSALLGKLRDELAFEAADTFKNKMEALGFDKEEMINFFLQKCGQIEELKKGKVG